MDALVRKLRRNETRILVGTVIVSVILGVWGLYELHRGQANWTLLDVLYRTMRMFALDLDAQNGSEQYPVQLQFARFLAPIVLIWAVVKAGIKLHESGRMERRRRTLMDHTIIIGHSRLAMKMLHELNAMDDDLEQSTVLFISDVPDPSMNAEVDNEGGCFLVGNPHLLDTWARARLEHARRVFIFTEDESENEDIGFVVVQAVRRDSIHRTVDVHMAISERLSAHTNDRFQRYQNAQVRVHLVDPHRVAARYLFLKHPPHTKRLPQLDETPIHLLIIGFTELAQQLLCQALRTCHYTDRRRPLVTIVDDEDIRAWARIQQRLPAMSMVADVQHLPEDPLSLASEAWCQLQERGEFDLVYIATGDRTGGLILAERASRWFSDENSVASVFLCQHEQSDVRRESSSHGYLTFVPTEEAYSFKHVARESLDALAMKIHGSYQAKYKGLPPWDRLSELDRNANRDASDHGHVVESMLLDAGYDWSDVKPQSDLEEILAEVEHRRWMASKIVAGFDYADIPKQEKRRKLHPLLVKYEALSEPEKQKDRDNVLLLARLNGGA